VAPGTFVATDLIDVRCSTAPDRPPVRALLHLGSAQVEARVRPLDARTWRLRLHRPLPLHVGDVGLLRDPGRRAVLTGVTVLDVLPPALTRRGAARRRAQALAAVDGRPDLAGELARRGVVAREQLVAMGVPPGAASDRWLVDPAHARALAVRLTELVTQHDADHPLDRGLPLEAARTLLDLPSTDVVRLVLPESLVVRGGRVTDAADQPDRLPPGVAAAVAVLVEELVGDGGVQAAEASRLDQLGLDHRAVAAAVRAGALVDLGGVLVAPAAVRAALGRLTDLPEPFTVAQARDAWQTSRKVAVPLLERLDRDGLTRRLTDGTRVLMPAAAGRGTLEA
jgi:selenocysteine-specific elongation factor